MGKSCLGSSHRIDNHLGGANVDAAFDENLNMYTLDAVVVTADRTKNQFGDTITEQSYYRTGGDVKVITREEIEKRHYVDVTDAIKRIPGVTFQNPGYRGGQYTYGAYQNTMAINGDSRVVILVDGRRVDNPTSLNMGKSSTGSKTMVDLNQILSMEDVEKIEVIKGPGASAYGSDATGGVINIITRKGGAENVGTIDLSTGSWDKHVYNFSYSGSAGSDKSWKYFITASRNMSGDSKYHDGLTNKDYTYPQTAYKDEGASIRIDKDFDDTHNLRIWYNHQNGKDGYPITAPDYRYLNPQGWQNVWDVRADGYSGVDNPGYRNVFLLDAISGSFNAYRNNDVDISYTFGKENGMESFVRVYQQKHHYWGRDQYPDWTIDNNGTPNDTHDDTMLPFPGYTQEEWDQFIKDHPASQDLTGIFDEQNRGIQLQLAKSYGKHDVIGSLTYDKSKTYTYNDYGDIENTHVERKTLSGYLQDKIHITDKWDFAPALRYVHYSAFGGTDSGESYKKHNSSVTKWTGAVNTEYAFDDTFSFYAGWTQVYRPLKSSDYDAITVNGDPLEDEKGNSYVIGLRKDIGANTTLNINYNWTRMDNIVVGYTVRNGSKYKDKRANAKETNKAFNISMDHRFNDHWNMGIAYTHLDNNIRVRDGMDYDPEIGIGQGSNVNLMVNELRPRNHYTLNLSYECNKWYTGLLANFYTGNNTHAFTSKNFVVLDWNLNYEVSKELTTYLTITNLTNEAYENAFVANNGIGAFPQPGRAFMIGARYKF